MVPMGDNATEEDFNNTDLELFTLNDLFNVIAYTVMSLGKYC